MEPLATGLLRAVGVPAGAPVVFSVVEAGGGSVATRGLEANPLTTTYTAPPVPGIFHVAADLEGGAGGHALSTVVVGGGGVLVSAPSVVTTGRTGLRASVPAVLGAVLVWDVDNGTITAGRLAPVVTFTAGAPGPMKLSCTWSGPTGELLAAASADITVVAVGVEAVAGQPGGPGYVDGPGELARFRRPSGLLADGDGTVLVADEGNHVIRRVSSDGTVTTLAGEPGERGAWDVSPDGGPPRFHAPSALAWGPGGVLLVADSANRLVRSVRVRGDGGVTVARWAGVPGEAGYRDGLACATTECALFRRPVGLAHDRRSGRVYVADSDNHALRAVQDGGVTTVAGDCRGGSCQEGTRDGLADYAQLVDPTGVAVDQASNVFFSDPASHTIRVVTSPGEPGSRVETWTGSANETGYTNGNRFQARFRRPGALLLLPDAGVLYVADTENRAVRRVGLQVDGGTVSTVAGGPANPLMQDGPVRDAGLGQVGGLANVGTTLLVADSTNHVLRAISLADNTVATRAGRPRSLALSATVTNEERLSSEMGGLAVDAEGTLYVSDTGRHVVRKVGPGSTVTTLAGQEGQVGNRDGPARVAQFNRPRGLSFLRDGTLVVADSGNGLVRLVSPAGTVSTLAGNGNLAEQDGPALRAAFNEPWDVDAREDGTVVVASRAGHTVRVISPQGFVNTLAGDAEVAGSRDSSPDGGATFSAPVSVAWDADGAVWVVDEAASTVRRVARNGHVTTVAGWADSEAWADGPGAQSRFRRPSAVVVDRRGRAYVADRGNHALRVVVPGTDGGWVVETEVGRPPVAGVRVGDRATATLNAPADLALTAEGDVLVVDGAEDVVVRVRVR
jgi:sugar lactone lactonase YvrE